MDRGGSPKRPKILPNDLEKDANILATIPGLETPRYHPLTHRFSPTHRELPRRENQRAQVERERKKEVVWRKPMFYSKH
jgi:hypothetical protein